ncbi:MAG TPA: Uma2 family endonuclease [Pyrinomonadaceae bacterium]|jgi:Uma2 family endonuclease|nr:Uma2 family endonuclease [Pyrinomonadaceae bacterium]
MQVLATPDQVNFSPLKRRYTLEEFWALPEREDRARYNLIGGYLFMVPPPNPPHGDLAANMNRALTRFLDAKGIGGKVLFPPEPIYTCAMDSTYLEPDLMYVSEELREQMGSRRTSADVVFEFLSRSTAVYDRTTKADTYLALGVGELWLVDPATETIEVRHPKELSDTRVWEIYIYERGEHAKSRVLDGWEVSVDGIFEDLD